MKQKTGFNPNGDRYQYDFGSCTVKRGYAQVDTSQDAWYYGTWANPTELKVVCYCEGDITYTECETKEEFVDYIREMAKYDFFRGIDGMLDEPIIAAFRELGLGDLLH